MTTTDQLTQPAPGTAGLYEMVQVDRAQRIQEHDERAKQGERMRAMLLCWVDDLERELGYGSGGDHPPRTSEIRQIWREMGQPAPKGRS